MRANVPVLCAGPKEETYK